MSAKSTPTYAHYLAIWAWLIALLIAGTFVSQLPLAHKTAVGIILLISLIKAVLVALFYMHLKFEKAVPLWVVAVFPFFLIGLATFLVFIGTALS
jgi:caa(3)-type oxidase subunit IV